MSWLIWHWPGPQPASETTRPGEAQRPPLPGPGTDTGTGQRPPGSPAAPPGAARPRGSQGPSRRPRSCPGHTLTRHRQPLRRGRGEVRPCPRGRPLGTRAGWPQMELPLLASLGPPESLLHPPAAGRAPPECPLTLPFVATVHGAWMGLLKPQNPVGRAASSYRKSLIPSSGEGLPGRFRNRRVRSCVQNASTALSAADTRGQQPHRAAPAGSWDLGHKEATGQDPGLPAPHRHAAHQTPGTQR